MKKTNNKKTASTDDYKMIDLVDAVVVKKDDTEEPVEEIKVKKLSPFDIINMIFCDNTAFDNLSDAALEQNFFIINRVFSVKYPMQAAFFAHNDGNKAAVIKCWRNFMQMKEPHGRVPSWCYAKGSKRAAEVKASETAKLTEEDKRQLALRLNVSMKDVDDMNTYIPERLQDELKHIKEISSVREQERIAFSSTKLKSKN